MSDDKIDRKAGADAARRIAATERDPLAAGLFGFTAALLDGRGIKAAIEDGASCALREAGLRRCVCGVASTGDVCRKCGVSLDGRPIVDDVRNILK